MTQYAIKVRVIHQLIVCRRPPQAQAQAQATRVMMATDACGIHGQKILTGGTFTKMEAKQFLIASVRVGVMADHPALRLNTLRILFTALIGTQIHVLIVTLLGSTSQVLMAKLASSRRRRHLRLHVGAHLLGEATGSVIVLATTLLATMTMVIARRLLKKKVMATVGELFFKSFVFLLPLPVAIKIFMTLKSYIYINFFQWNSFFFVAQVAATAAPTLAVVTTVVVPREGRRDALTVTLMVSALRARPGTTSPATSATSAEVGKQVLLDPHLRALAYRCQKKKTVALAMTTAIARVPLVVVGTAVV